MIPTVRYACAALAATLLTAAPAASQSYQGPDTGSVASGVVVTTATFGAASAAAFGGPAFREPRNKIRFYRNPPASDQALNRPATNTTFVADAPAGGPSSSAPPPITLASVDGMRDPGNFIPPDPYIAAGPRHAIVVDNGRFRILDRQGRTLATITADTWFSTTLSRAAAFDPKVTFDHYAGRWIMVWLDQSDSEQRSFFLVSVSDNDDPLGTWYNWALPAGVNGSVSAGNWADYQGVGFDQHALYITSNNWEFAGSYDYSKIRIIPKSDLYANTAGRVRWTDLWNVRDRQGSPAFTIRPVIAYGSPGAYYFVSLPLSWGGSSITLYTLTNPLTSPVLTARTVPVSAWSEAPQADQLGGSATKIESGGSGLSNEPVYRDSSVWLVHSIGTAGRYSSVRYLRISTVNGAVMEDGALGMEGYWYFYPAIAVDKDQNVAITYSRSGESEYIGAYMAWRLATDSPGQLRPGIQLQAGKGNYVKTFGSERNRWGDYMGIALDPLTMQEFWMYTEYAVDKDLWGNWVHNVRLTPYAEKRILAGRTEHDFGRCEAGTVSDTVAFTVRNVGATPLTISSVSVATPSFRIINPPAVPHQLALWDSLVIRAAFTPQQHGEERDSIVIASDDPLHPAYSLVISGKGIEVGAAQPGVMYAAGRLSPAYLYAVDLQGGAATEIGPTGVLSIKGLAVHPVTKELHGSVQHAGGTDIVRLSSGFGDAMTIRTIPYNNIRGFVYIHPDTMLAVGFTPGRPDGMVYRIGPSARDTVTLSVNPSTFLSGLAYDSSTGALRASVMPAVVNRDKVFSVDPVSGALTLIGSTGLGQGIASLVFDPTGTLFGLQVNGALIDIDPTTGAGTVIGPSGISGASAITMSPGRSPTDVGGNPVDTAPAVFRLDQNYPNPFNPTTEIGFHVPAGQAGGAGSPHVTLIVYDMLGREVAVLVDERKAPGSYSVEFNASRFASGVYLYRLSAGSFVQTRKMILAR